MRKRNASSRRLSSGLLAFVALGAVASTTIACGQPDAEKKQATWSCTRDEVPMGEVVRCSTSALTADGPVTTGGTTTTTGGTTDGTTTGGALLPDPTAPLPTAYSCSGDYVALDCPPIGATGGDGSDPIGTGSGSTSGGTATTGGTTDGTAGSGGTSGSSGGTSGATPVGTMGASSGANGNSSGNSGHTTDGTGPNGSNSGGTTNGGGGSSHQRGPDECSWVPDLDYCGGSGGSSSGGTTSSSSGGTGAGSDCTKSNCDVPGQGKKDGTSSSSSGGAGGATSSSSSSGGTTDGTSSSSSGGASSSGGGGHNSWSCTKDDNGNRICASTPKCAPGTHAAACGACVDDSDTSGGDCVPPSDGGCWITGGGFIEGAGLVPAAPADGKDNFGGNAKPMKKGGVSGHWNHVDHGTGNHAKGRPEYIMCRVTDGPGPKQPGGKKGLVVNQVYFGGHAQWREAAAATWSDGYWFDVVAEDHGEPGNTSAIKNGAMPDSYHFTIRKMDDPAAKVSGAIVYETRDDLRGGNIQIHPSNPGHPAVSSPLPGWVSLEQ